MGDRSSKKKRHPSEAEPGRRITNGGGGREVLYVPGFSESKIGTETEQASRGRDCMDAAKTVLCQKS